LAYDSYSDEKASDGEEKESQQFVLEEDHIFDMYDDKKGVLMPNANGDNPHVFFQIKQGKEDLGR
jgi:hypothetical protein